MKKNAKRKIGTSLLMSAIVAGSAVIPLANPKAEEAPNLKYSAHVENIGWQDMVGIGKYAGTEGQALRLEAIKVQRENLEGVELTFDVHVENEGWKNGLKETDVIGSEGKAQRLEAIRVYTKGLEEKGYKLQYKVHVEDLGWTNWTNEGEMAGTEGQAKRVEAIEFRLVKAADLKLEAAKEDALNQLSREYKAENYTINAKDFDAKMTEGKKAINDAKNVASVTSALTKVLGELAKIPSDTTELAGLDSSKNTNIASYMTELNRYATVAKDAQVIKSAIETTRKAGTELIDNATSAGSVTAAKTTALENAVIAAADAAQTELDRLYKEGQRDATTGKVSYLTEEAYKTQTDIITGAIKGVVGDSNKATNQARVTAIVKAYTDAKDALQEFTTIRKDASDKLKTIKTAVESSDLFKNVDAIMSALDTGINTIGDASTRDVVSKTLQTTTSTVLRLAKSTAKAELDKKYNNGKAVKYEMVSSTAYNTALDAINGVEAINDATEVNTLNDAVKNIATTRVGGEENKAESTYKALEAVTETLKSDFSDILKEAESILQQATKVSEVEKAKEDAEEKILAREKNYYVTEINKLRGETVTETEEGVTVGYYYSGEVCNTYINKINNTSVVTNLESVSDSFKNAAKDAYQGK